LPAQPQFDAVMTKAMMGLVQGETAVPSLQQDAADATVAPALPLLPTVGMAQAAHLPPPDPIAATTGAAPVQAPAMPAPTAVATMIPAEQAGPLPAPAATEPAVAISPTIVATVLAAMPDTVLVKAQDGTKVDTADRQRTGRLPRREAAAKKLPPASAQTSTDPSVTPTILVAPVVMQQINTFVLPATPSVAASDAPIAKLSPDATDRRGAQVKSPATGVKLAVPQPVLPDAPAPALHEASVVPALPPQAQTTSPAAQVLSVPPLPTDAPLQAAPSSAPASPSAHAASTPAAQIAPVLVSMAHAPDGAQRLTLRLDPPELGHVQIRIDRPQDAPARVDITVERAETLTLLLRDQPQLQRALDQAGVPSDGRTVTIHVAATESAARPDSGPAAAQGMGSAGTGDATYGTPRQGGQQARHATGNPDEVEGDIAQIVLPGWMRGGLDITA
jgi:flagellar hook-length control protein FliK